MAALPDNMHHRKRGKRGKKKDEQRKKIPKIFHHLLYNNGLEAKGIQHQSDGWVSVNSILDIDSYSEYTEDDVYEALFDNSEYEVRQCPNTGHLMVRVAGATGGVQNKLTEQHAKQEVQGQESHGRKKLPQRDHVFLSKTLSWLLRHGAEKAGFHLQDGGFLYVDEILSYKNFKGCFTADDIKQVVETNDKQRFHLEPHPDNGRLRIRANQGHSLQVEGLHLIPVISASDCPVVLHGTYSDRWPAISSQGLKRMKRTHIHFAPGEPGEEEVISGMRKSCDVLIFIDIEKALQGGFKFFRSSNNVIVCPGNADGCIPPEFFKEVINKRTRESLL